MFRENRKPALIVTTATLLLVALTACEPPADVAGKTSGEEAMEKIPITTESAQAKELYLEGRAMAENIRRSEARELFEQAVKVDPDFATAHLALAFVANSPRQFFDGLERAVELADEVSVGERLMILGSDAGVRSDPAAQKEYFTKLVKLFPDDERAHVVLAGFYFGRQDYERANELYRRATELNPEFASAYNQLGYVNRAAGNFEEAEEAFKRYIELIPAEPNPYDSYAEFLMKIGRFEESIDNYKKALEMDSHFVPSFVGIGHNQMFMDRSEAARETFKRLYEEARDDGERRQALFWTAASYLYDGDHKSAGIECHKMHEIAEASEDWAQVSGDLLLMGNILLDEGQYDAALDQYEEASGYLGRSDVNDDVKEAFGRNQIYRKAKVVIEKGSVQDARGMTEAYAEAVATKNIPFEVRRVHELQGLVALKAGDASEAVNHLEQANLQNPLVLLDLARASRAAGDLESARKYADSAGNWNQLGMAFAFARNPARELATEL